ncbi:MAG: transaldolase family protein [Phycisphaerae bacterium]
MALVETTPDLAEHVKEFILADFHPRYGQLAETFTSSATWRRLRELGTELWLDTGDIDEAAGLWTREFTALTTNNTLLNKEVQKGQYDDLIASAAKMLREYGLDERRMVLEIAFILNARHALRLVERFDAYVSVEEHTDLADDLALAVQTAKRYHAICPERFIVKLPFTPAGLLATRILSRDGVSVNHTLGFSARQNYAITRIGRPAFVNVFLGRLNSVIADNRLGDGRLVGERATLASQRAVRMLRRARNAPTRQIGASFREGPQVRDLAGINVMTLPPKVARQFLDMGLPPASITDRTGQDLRTTFAPGVDERALRINSLWEIDQPLVRCLDDLERENLDSFAPADLVRFFAGHGCRDFLPDWSADQRARSLAEGKIPRIDNWRSELSSGACAMDSLMNLAGLGSFIADQKAMDDRVRGVLARK